MHNTSLSGLLRGVQSRHDDCGISWVSHEPTRSNDDDNAKVIAHLEKLCHEKRRADIECIKRVAASANNLGGGLEHFGKQMQKCLDGVATAISRIPELRRASQSHIVKWGSPPFQYRNPRIDGPVANQDEMDQRKEWLDIIARESERLQDD